MVHYKLNYIHSIVNSNQLINSKIPTYMHAQLICGLTVYNHLEYLVTISI